MKKCSINIIKYIGVVIVVVLVLFIIEGIIEGISANDEVVVDFDEEFVQSYVEINLNNNTGEVSQNGYAYLPSEFFENKDNADKAFNESYSEMDDNKEKKALESEVDYLPSELVK